MSTRARATSMRAVRHGQQRTLLDRILRWLYGAGEQGIAVPDLTPGNGFLFQDSAGTTPVTAFEQPVGTLLDRRSPGYSLYFDGAEDYLVCATSSGFAFGTGDFTIEAWVYPTATKSLASPIADTLQIGGLGSRVNAILLYIDSSNKLCSFNNSSNFVRSSASILLNTWTHVAITRSGTSVRLWINGVNDGSATNAANLTSAFANIGVTADVPTNVNGHFAGYISNVRIVKGTAVYTGSFTPPTAPLAPITGTSLLTCGTSWSGNPTITVVGDTRVSGLNPFQASPVGNHIIQATSTKRPTLSARYNGLLNTEFSGAVAGTPGTAPTSWGSSFNQGTLSLPAFGQLNIAVSNARQFITQAFAAATSSTYSCSVLVNANSGIPINNILGFTSPPAGSTISYFINNLPVSSSAVPAAGNRIEIRLAVASTAGTPSWRIGAGVADVETGNVTFSQPDLRRTIDTIGQPAYQRVGASNDYDTAGFFPYLAFDGTDDSMATAASVDFTGTDKMTVFHGVTKLSDTAEVSIFELSADSFANSGSFSLFNNVASSAQFRWASRGTSTRPISGGSAAPATVVNTGRGDISADVAELRVNGSSVGTNTSDQGTGNYGNYSLFLGARNNASLFFNGRVYPFFIRGAATDAGLISQTEQFLKTRMPVNF